MKQIRQTLDFIPEYDMRSICSPEEMLLFDIETTGLRKETTQLYMIGCAYYEDESWHTIQWLTENTSDEMLVLEEFLKFASGFRTLVHFNGDGFDIPYLRYKLEYYMLDPVLDDMGSFDIYKYIKRARRLLGLSSMSQRSMEEFLGIRRKDRMNGGLLIPVYYEYEKTGSSELEDALLLHNFDDLQGMLKILPTLGYGDIFDGRYTFEGMQEYHPQENVPETAGSDTLILNYRMQTPVPVGCDVWTGLKNAEDIEICAEGDLLQINIRIYHDTGRIILENVADYYYLPEEDRVIHKDVAQFVGKCKKVRATKKNCFLKKEGCFVPVSDPALEPVFHMAFDRKRAYADCGQLLQQQDRDIFLRLAAGILREIES